MNLLEYENSNSKQLINYFFWKSKIGDYKKGGANTEEAQKQRFWHDSIFS